jgi:hypothetical protein
MSRAHRASMRVYVRSSSAFQDADAMVKSVLSGLRN